MDTPVIRPTPTVNIIPFPVPHAGASGHSPCWTRAEQSMQHDHLVMNQPPAYINPPGASPTSPATTSNATSPRRPRGPRPPERSPPASAVSASPVSPVFPRQENASPVERKEYWVRENRLEKLLEDKFGSKAAAGAAKRRRESHLLKALNSPSIAPAMEKLSLHLPGLGQHLNSSPPVTYSPMLRSPPQAPPVAHSIPASPAPSSPLHRRDKGKSRDNSLPDPLEVARSEYAAARAEAGATLESPGSSRFETRAKRRKERFKPSSESKLALRNPDEGAVSPYEYAGSPPAVPPKPTPYAVELPVTPAPSRPLEDVKTPLEREIVHAPSGSGPSRISQTSPPYTPSAADTLESMAWHRKGELEREYARADAPVQELVVTPGEELEEEQVYRKGELERQYAALDGLAPLQSDVNGVEGLDRGGLESMSPQQRSAWLRQRSLVAAYEQFMGRGA